MNPTIPPSPDPLLTAYPHKERKSPTKKAPFHLLHTHNRPLGGLIHPGLGGKPSDAYEGDLQELVNKGLVWLRSSASSELIFDVRPEGFSYYEELRRKQGAGLERVERSVRTALETNRFRELYPKALERWSQAESLLWEQEIEKNLTNVGHILREGIQRFAAELVTHVDPSLQFESLSLDQARVKAILGRMESVFGKTTREALEALWVATSNLVQRLVHGGQRKGEPVTWEDARRAVFLVAAAMVEVDLAVAPAPPE